MSKNTAKSFAEEGLEDVQEESVAAEASLKPVEDTADGELVEVGGYEPVEFFYRFSAPKKAGGAPYKILEKGQTITGKYDRSFTTDGKFGKKSTYLIRIDTGKLVGLPGVGSLAKKMESLAEGSLVKITYNGMEAIKGGQWAGEEAHTFTVLGNKFKPKQA